MDRSSEPRIVGRRLTVDADLWDRLIRFAEDTGLTPNTACRVLIGMGLGLEPPRDPLEIE